MIDRLRTLRWNIIGPVALLAAALAGVAWFDLTTSGEAKPPPLAGAVGTPVRGTFVPPTPTPIGARPTPKSRPTVGAVPGTPAERDGRRRNDLLIILDGFNKLKAREGSYPSTNNNLQTLCVFKQLDVGCKLKEVITGTPEDPLGNPLQNGYWYQSDGKSLKIYASFEQDIPPDQQCPTDNVDLKKKANLICVTAS